MKWFEWNEEKNKKLIKTRNVSFKQVVMIITGGKVLDIIRSKNPKYKHQRRYIIKINEYIYVVPFVEDEDKIFLKTIYPNRKLTKKYLKVINSRKQL